MKKQESVQPPAECNESTIEVAMEQWLDRAQNSSDIRDRIAVANGISRGVFGSLHFGQLDLSEPESDISESNSGDCEEFRRAA